VLKPPSGRALGGDAGGEQLSKLESSSSVNMAITSAHPYPTATFNGKASIQDITDPLNPMSIDGNATLQVTMTDKGEPGSSDTIGITVWNKSGGLWFSSNWNGTKTVEQVGINLRYSNQSHATGALLLTFVTAQPGLSHVCYVLIVRK